MYTDVSASAGSFRWWVIPRQFLLVRIDSGLFISNLLDLGVDHGNVRSPRVSFIMLLHGSWHNFFGATFFVYSSLRSRRLINSSTAYPLGLG